MAEENFDNVYSKIQNYGIIPAITIEEINLALPVSEALSSGGLNIAEVNFDTEQSAAVIKKISSFFPNMLLIAVDVSTAKQAKSAAMSGAKAIISRGFDKSIISYCAEINMPVIPECSYRNEIKEALDEGIDVIGLDLSGKTGGIDKLKELSSEYPQVKFVLRGGITEDNLADFLAHKSVIACRTSYMCEEEYITKNEFGRIKELTSRMIYKMLDFGFSHVVINCEHSDQADQYASKIESLFGFKKSDEENAISNADIVRFMKSKSYGKNGQLAISTDFMDRAVFYLRESNQDLIEESARYDSQGELASIYLDSMISGFAIKLVKK